MEYYFALLPGVIPSHAMARLTLVSVNDASPRPLSEELLERPRLLARIAGLVPDPSRSHLIPYNTTSLERDLALALGIPVYGADPRLFELGTRPDAAASSPRRAFATPSASRTFTRSKRCWTPPCVCASDARRPATNSQAQPGCLG